MSRNQATLAGSGTGGGMSVCLSYEGSGAVRSMAVFNSTFISNRAAAVGGGALYVRVEDGGGMPMAAEVRGCTFRGNWAAATVAGEAGEADGGAVLLFPTPGFTATTLADSVFEGNSAADTGGAVALRVEGTSSYGALHVTNCSFRGNVAHGSGGGALSVVKPTNNDVPLTLLRIAGGSRFLNNSCGGIDSAGGGAVYTPGVERVDIAGGIEFSSNAAAFGSGGALFLGSPTSVSVSDAVFSSNRAPTGDGGVICVRSELLAVDSVVLGPNVTARSNSANNGTLVGCEA